MKTKLTGIPETLLIPMWARAAESKMPRPIVRDEKATEILSQIDYDFSKFQKARMTQLGVAIRTMLLDKAIASFIEANPKACVINIGAGLDTRYHRINCGSVLWYELDLPEALDLRRRFFRQTKNYRYLAKSVFDYTWFEDVKDAQRPVLLIAEGIFMYFTQSELKNLFANLVRRFPGAQMLLEVQGPAIVGRSRQHDSLRKIDDAPEFKWGIKDARDMATWNRKIEYVEQWCYFDYHKERSGWFGKIANLPFIRPRIAPRIVRLRFKKTITAKDAAMG